MKKLLPDTLTLIKFGFISIMSLLAPIHPILLATGVLIAIDFITGIVAAKKKGETINSRKMSNSIGKLVLYNLLIISAFVFEKYITGGFIPAVKAISMLLGLVELKSIIENFDKIYGHNIWSKVKSIFKRKPTSDC